MAGSIALTVVGFVLLALCLLALLTNPHHND